MANMTLRHIQTFLAVVDNECSITKAADFLHVAQPSVSQTIADMENHYNFQFFDRLNRKLYLTNAGKKLLPYADVLSMILILFLQQWNMEKKMFLCELEQV